MKHQVRIRGVGYRPLVPIGTPDGTPLAPAGAQGVTVSNAGRINMMMHGIGEGQPMFTAPSGLAETVVEGVIGKDIGGEAHKVQTRTAARIGEEQSLPFEQHQPMTAR